VTVNSGLSATPWQLQVAGGAGWFGISATSGTGGPQILSYTVMPNGRAEARSASLTLTASGASAVHSLSRKWRQWRCRRRTRRAADIRRESRTPHGTLAEVGRVGYLTDWH